MEALAKAQRAEHNATNMFAHLQQLNTAQGDQMQALLNQQKHLQESNECLVQQMETARTRAIKIEHASDKSNLTLSMIRNIVRLKSKPQPLIRNLLLAVAGASAAYFTTARCTPRTAQQLRLFMRSLLDLLRNGLRLGMTTSAGIVYAISNVLNMIVRLRQTMPHDGYIPFVPPATIGMALPQQHQHIDQPDQDEPTHEEFVMCAGSAVMTTASTVKIFTVNPESIADAERRQHLISVLDDSGATGLLTNHLAGLVGGVLEDASGTTFKTMDGNKQVQHKGLFTRTLVGLNGQSFTFTDTWYYKPDLPFDIVGRPALRRLTQSMHGEECYYDSKPGSPPMLAFTGTPTIIQLHRASDGLDWMQYTTTMRPMQLIATTIEEQLLSSAEYNVLQDSSRQHSIAEHAYVSEAYSGSTICAGSIVFRGMYIERGIDQTIPTPIFSDSRSTLLAVRSISSLKTSLSILRRTLFMIEGHDEGLWDCYTCKGPDNPADVFTKPVGVQPFTLARAIYLGNHPGPLLAT